MNADGSTRIALAWPYIFHNATGVLRGEYIKAHRIQRSQFLTTEDNADEHEVAAAIGDWDDGEMVIFGGCHHQRSVANGDQHLLASVRSVVFLARISSRLIEEEYIFGMRQLHIDWESKCEGFVRDDVTTHIHEHRYVELLSISRSDNAVVSIVVHLL